jgi:hypothetical protein
MRTPDVLTAAMIVTQHPAPQINPCNAGRRSSLRSRSMGFAVK